MLTLPPKFKQALGNGTRTSLYPLVRIYKGVQIDESLDSATEVINLSIKETNIGGEAYNPLLLNSPSISSKADIINAKYTISTVSLSISNNQYNGKIFSDDIQSLLNSMVQVYYAANGLETLDDCLLVYTGTIRRYTQSAETVNLTLEDLTQQKLSIQIPTTIIEDENLYTKEQIGKPYPMVYGYVDNSPLIINQQNDLEIDKPNQQIFDVWNKNSQVSFNNPYITSQHPLIIDGWLSDKATLSVYNDGYLKINQILPKQFGSRVYDDFEDYDQVYSFSNSTTNTSAKLNLNENVFLYEKYVESQDNTNEIIGEGSQGIPTRIYRPVVDVSFYAKHHTNFTRDYLGSPEWTLASSCFKFFGYTNNSLNSGVAKHVNVLDTADTNANNDFCALDDLYDDNWENGDKTWWKSSAINNSVGQHSEYWSYNDTNWENAGYDSKFPVDYIQNNEYESGLHINAQKSYEFDGGAFARLQFDEDIGSYPCVTKILYNLHYYTPTNVIYNERVFVGHSIRQDLHYHPVIFWVEKELFEEVVEYNRQWVDMTGPSNRWQTFYDTEDWYTECQVPNVEHQFSPSESDYRYTTDNTLAGDNYDNIILKFNTTNAFNSIQWGMPNIRPGSFFLNDYGSTMASLRNFYTLQDCLVTDIYNQNFYASVVGRADATGNVISKPQFILRDLLKNELNYDGNLELPDVSIEDDWINSFTLNEQKEAKNIVEDLFKSSIYIPSFNSNGEFKFLDLMQTESDFTQYPIIKNEDIITYSYSLTKLDDVKNQVNVKYKKDYGSGEYLEQTGYGIKDNNGIVKDTLDDVSEEISGFPNIYDIAYYGLKSVDAKLEFESEYIRDEITARKLQRKLLMWYANQHLIIKLDLPSSYMHLEVGDYIRFDELIGGKLAFGQDYTQEEVKNGQTIYPVFFINKISKSLNKVNIEAVQMHRGEVGIDDTESTNYVLGNPYDNPVYEPEIEEDTTFFVNWVNNRNNFGISPLTAVVDTDIEGTENRSFNYRYWLRFVSESVALEKINGDYFEYPVGSWEIGEMPDLPDFGNIIHETAVYNDFGGTLSIANRIENTLEIAEQHPEFFILWTIEFSIPGEPNRKIYKDLLYKPGLQIGDVTGDQVVNILDVVNMVQAILGFEDLDDLQEAAADVNEDGVVNVLDVINLVQIILGQ